MRSCNHNGCQNKIPATIKIDGKSRNLKNRIYCLDCSPFGKHNTRQLDSKEKKEKDKLNETSKIYLCSLCNRNFQYKRGAGSTKVFCASCQVTRSRQKRKLLAVEYKGGSCSVCGYNKSMRALEFHHLDPSKKDFGFSDGTQKSWDLQKLELDKCILLCCRCHAEVHDKILDLTNIITQEI